MFGHFPELIIILAIGLIVFGPEKLPEVAANAGKIVREFRGLIDTAMNPVETQVPEDFSQYYYESLARAGEEPAVDDEMRDDGFYEVLDEGDEIGEGEDLATEPLLETEESPSSEVEVVDEIAVRPAPHDEA